MNWFQIKRYFWYLLHAKHRKGYGIHPPFAFNLVRELLYDDNVFYDFERIRDFRKEVVHNPKMVEIEDWGAGSTFFKKKFRRIGAIAKHSCIRPKYGEVLYRLVHYFQCKNIIELGTSLGISTMYLSLPNVDANVVTIDGCKGVALEAGHHFKKMEIENIEQRIGVFDQELPALLEKFESIDFLFVDGHHTKDATLKYFNQMVVKANENSVFVFDDIHWSADMEEAWRIISNDTRVTVSIDLFQLGLVFFKPKFQPQHYLVRY